MSEDKKDFPSSGDNINQEGSFGVGINEGTVHQNVTNNFYPPHNEKSAQSPQDTYPQAVTDFLKDIETRFQYFKSFHRQEKVLLQNQYIPIELTLERRYKHEIETTWGYAESEAELEKIYALKGMAEETRKEQVKWEEARKKHQKLIVLADPGMGKSTLLRMEALKIARKQGEGSGEKRIEEIVFPLFLRLSELAERAGEILEIVPELINREYSKTAPAIEPLLKEKLRQGKCILLLDALDEVPKEQRQELSRKLNRFACNYDCSIICTSRIVGYGGGFLDGAKEVEIVPFNKQQREAYITSWFTNAKEHLADEIVSAQGLIRELQQKPQISGLAQNSLLLSLLCSLYQEKELVLPARRCEVYTQAVEYMLFKWRNSHKPVDDAWVDAKEELLEEIAYCLSCEDKEVFSLRELRRQIDKFLKGDDCSSDFSHAKATDLINELTQDDGIIQLLPGTDNKYLFLHRTFQEYFTASYLKRVIEEDEARGIELAKAHFWEFDWHETLSLLAGLLDNSLPLLAVIMAGKDDIFRHQLLLAGQCVAECNENENGLIGEVIEEIYEFWKFNLHTSWIDQILVLLGKTHNYMFQCVLEGLEDNDVYVRWEAVEVLGNIGDSQAIFALITTLNDPNLYVRSRTAEALGNIGDSQAVSALITTLTDPNSDVRWAVAEALGNIGDSQAVSALITTLTDPDSDVRWIAAKALGNIGDSQAVSALITTLTDPGINIRWETAKELGKRGASQIISILIDALTDSNSDVRSKAVYALGKIGNKQAISVLITTLNDSDSDVRYAAASALGKIGNKQAISVLITTLNDSDSDVRYAAASALGKIGNKQAISVLITTLNDSDSDVRWAAASALGKIGNQETLKQILKNPNLDIYDHAIFYHIKKLATSYSKAKVHFIPVYPETVDFLREQGTRNRQQGK